MPFTLDTVSSFPEAELGYPLIESYAFRPMTRSLRLDMADGPARYLKIAPGAGDVVDVVWHFTPAQMTRFRQWYYNDLQQVGWFELSLSFGNSVAAPQTWDLQPRRAHFVEEWTATLEPQSGDWRVSASLEVQYEPVP